MSFPELQEISELRDRWVAIAPTGTYRDGIASLRTGEVVVDYDDELDELCARIADSHKTSLTIVYAGQARA